MLVLTRKKSQTIVIGDPGGGESLLVITVLEIAGGRVRIGFTTASGVPIHRGEKCNRAVTTSAVPDPVGDTVGIRGGSRSAAAVGSLSLPTAYLPARPAPRTMHEVIAAARTRLAHAAPSPAARHVPRPAESATVPASR